MNQDVFEGKWKQVRGEVRGWWGKLSDEDIDFAGFFLRDRCVLRV